MKERIKTPILTMEETAAQPPVVNLQVTLKGNHAKHFRSLKRDMGVTKNTEVAGMILRPVLDLIAEIGLPRFMALVGENGQAKPANRTRA